MKPQHLTPYDSVLDTIGWTPLIRLARVGRGIRTPVYGKAEYVNPGASVKDRIGLAIIEDAERRGELKPGGVIVEGTSGNTGVGLAIAAALKGYRCIFTMPDKMSQEKVRLLKAYGAEVVITEGTLEKVDASEFDGFYFFNPFGEYVAADEDRYDLSSPRSFDAYIRDARLVERWLRQAPPGTAMVTYNGLGGRIPVSYRVRHTTHVRDDTMRLWVKEKADDSREAYIEIEEELITASQLARMAAENGAGFADSPLVRELSTPAED